MRHPDMRRASNFQMARYVGMEKRGKFGIGLHVHEILDHIFGYLQREGRWGDLVRCSQVSKHWFNHASPLIWEDISSLDHPKRVDTEGAKFNPLVHMIKHLEPHRRDEYAWLIKRATIYTVSEEEVKSVRRVFDGVDLLHLEDLRIILTPGAKLPRWKHSSPYRLTFDARLETDPQVLEKVFEQVSVRYNPHAAYVVKLTV